MKEFKELLTNIDAVANTEGRKITLIRHLQQDLTEHRVTIQKNSDIIDHSDFWKDKKQIECTLEEAIGDLQDILNEVKRGS